MNRCWSRLPHLTLRSHPPETYFDRSKNILDWDKKPCQRCQPVLVHSFSRFCTTSCMPSVCMWSSHSHWTSYDLVIQHLLWQLWSSSDGFVPDNREVGFAGKVLSHCDLGEVAHDLCTLHYEWWIEEYIELSWLYKSEYRGVYVQDNMPHSSGNKNGFSWMLNTLHRGVPGVQFFVKSRITRGRTYKVLSSDQLFLLMHWIKYHIHYIFTTLYTIPSRPIRPFGSWVDDREPSDRLIPLK